MQTEKGSRHSYYAQVQGQMGVTGAKWCDFIVYTSRGMYLERIAFDPNYWQTLRNQLLQYYFEHFIKFAAVDIQNAAAGTCSWVFSINCFIICMCHIYSNNASDTCIQFVLNAHLPKETWFARNTEGSYSGNMAHAFFTLLNFPFQYA